EDGIRDRTVTGVQTCALPISGTVIGDADTLLASGTRGDEGAVGVENGLVEEVGRLLFPDLDPGLIEDVLEDLDVVGLEAAAEVRSEERRVGKECRCRRTGDLG